MGFFCCFHAEASEPRREICLGCAGRALAHLLEQSQTYPALCSEECKELPPKRALLQLRLDDFEVLNTIGVGTFSRVHLARHVDKEECYAIKKLSKAKVSKLKQIPQTRNEIHILARLRHAFMVELFAVFQDDFNLYAVLDYVPGGELFSLLKRQHTLPESHARFYAAEILVALKFLHSYDVCYRDLKPENILISRAGHVKLTDFGFAKVVHDRTYTMCGTAEYVAPEVINHVGHAKSPDWWGLGVVLFEMLHGASPFYDKRVMSVYKKVLKGNVHFSRHTSRHAKGIITRLLTVDRTQRLGCGSGGARDVEAHAFFKPIDIAAVEQLRVNPPFVPTVGGPQDTSNYQSYEEASFETEANLSMEEREQFDLIVQC